MKAFFKRINDNYGIEITFFNKTRKFSDGITFYDGKINLDRYESYLTLFNIIIFEINIS